MAALFALHTYRFGFFSWIYRAGWDWNKLSLKQVCGVFVGGGEAVGSGSYVFLAYDIIGFVGG